MLTHDNSALIYIERAKFNVFEFTGYIKIGNKYFNFEAFHYVSGKSNTVHEQFKLNYDSSLKGFLTDFDITQIENTIKRMTANMQRYGLDKLKKKLKLMTDVSMCYSSIDLDQLGIYVPDT